MHCRPFPPAGGSSTNNFCVSTAVGGVVVFGHDSRPHEMNHANMGIQIHGGHEHAYATLDKQRLEGVKYHGSDYPPLLEFEGPVNPDGTNCESNDW